MQLSRYTPEAHHVHLYLRLPPLTRQPSTAPACHASQEARKLASAPVDVAVLHYYLARVLLQESGAVGELLDSAWCGSPAALAGHPALPPPLLDGLDAAAGADAGVAGLQAAAADSASGAKRQLKPLGDLAKLKVVDLRRELKLRGLNTKGLRKDLLSRLTEAVAADAAEAEKQAPAKRSFCLAKPAKVPVKGDGGRSSDASMVRATTMLTKAFSACRNLGMPSLVGHVGLLLAQTHGRRHELRAAMHQHMSLGIAARQAVCLGLMDASVAPSAPAGSAPSRKGNGRAKGGKKTKTKRAPTPTLPGETEAQALFSFQGVETEDDFAEQYVRRLPGDFTVCGVSVDPETNGVLVSRLSSRGDSWCRRVSPAAVDRLEAEEGIDGEESGKLPGIVGLCDRFAAIQRECRRLPVLPSGACWPP